MSGAIEHAASGIRVRLRVTPKAGIDRLDGEETRDDGRVVLRVRVRAVADRGKANAAVIALLAKACGVSPSAVSLVSGETARLKVMHVTGDPQALAARLAGACER